MLTKEEADLLKRELRVGASASARELIDRETSSISEPTNEEKAPEPSCDLCGDNTGPLEVHARCHMTAPLAASFEDGVMTLSCYLPECRRTVASFLIEKIV